MEKRTTGKKAAPKKVAKKTGRPIKTTTSKKAAPKKQAAKKVVKKWSAKVIMTSDALDVQPHIFESGDPAKIARSLKRSAEKSTRKKGTPFQSAMSMLNFYLNRAGKNLSAAKKKPLERAKDELRKLYNRE